MPPKQKPKFKITREQIVAEVYRRDLLKFTCASLPHYQPGWVHRKICDELKEFYQAVDRKESPRLMINMPPRHGKTELASRHFPAWAFANNPELNIIGCAYAADLSQVINRDIQRIIDGPIVDASFPHVQLNGKNVRSDAKGSYIRNSEKFEIVGHKGAYRSAGVGQGITGMGADILIIDDPVKDFEEARSPVQRERVWNWYNSTAYTRLSPGGGVLLIMTRWHQDDLSGRLLEAEKDGADKWRHINFPAIAEQDEEHRKMGEALHPERYSVERLRKIEKAVGAMVWGGLFQQHPAPKEGGMFNPHHFQTLERMPRADEISASCRAWDKAGTEGGGAYTAGVLVHRMKDGRLIISDVRRGQWSALEREKNIKQCAEVDGKKVKVSIEQEPGSGGKESAQATVRNLLGYTVVIDRVTGSKETRAEPYSAQVEGGNVWIVRGPWNREFLDEHEMFPNGKYKDQVDATTQAMATLVGGDRLAALNKL